MNDCLYALLDEALYNRVLRICPDRRKLLETAADYAGLAPLTLLEMAAHRMDLPVCRKIPATRVTKLPAEVSHEEIIAAGCMLVCDESGVRQIICCDPSTVAWLRELCPLASVSVALWSEIEAELSRNKTCTTPFSVADNESIDDRCTRAIEQVLRRVEAAGQREFGIRKADGRLEYRYLRTDGRYAAGSFHQLLTLSLWDFLQSLSARRREHATLLASWPELTVSVASDEMTLVLTKRDACGGRIEEEQSENVLSFPRPQSAAGSEVVEASAANPSTQDPAVLVVDDNSTFSKVLERFFSRHHIRTLHAREGNEALSMLRTAENRVDAVVCDVHMPGMNGFDFVRQVRADAALRDLPVIMLTSDTDIEVQLQLLERGADAFVAKNEDPRLLCVQVQRLILRSQARRAA